MINLVKSRPISVKLLPLLLVAIFPSFAHAHVGVGPTPGCSTAWRTRRLGSIISLAMVAVGLWAAQRGGRANWLIPLAFVTVMAVGSVLGMMAISIPFVEQGIVASLLVLGVLIATAVRLPLVASMTLVGLFALFHGHAHGAEMPDTAAGIAYSLGFILATICLNGVGIGLGATAKRVGTERLVRYAGGAIALCGLYLCIG